MMHEAFSPDLFKKRTKELINQYTEKCSALGSAFYDVTLSINCLYGLLIMPEEQHRNLLPVEEAVSFLGKNGITPDRIHIEAKENGVPCSINFKEFIVALRNGLAHWGRKPEKLNNFTDGTHNVDFQKNDEDIVEKIIITGTLNRYKIIVKATFYLLNKNSEPDNPIPAFLALIQPE